MAFLPTQYRLSLSEEDRLFVKFRTRRSKIVEFVLQYHALTPKGWRTIIRYDTKDGIAHKDIYAYSKRKKTRPHEILGTDLNMIFTQALKDIKINWKKIKENFMFQ